MAGVEQKLMCRDTEQGLGQLPHPRLEEILYILAGQYQQRVFLPVTLHEIADVFNGRQIGEEQVQLIQRSHIVACSQQGVGHVGQDGKEQGVSQAAVELHDALDPKHQEFVILNIGMPVEILAFRALAHRVEPQAHLLDGFLGKEVFPFGVVQVEFFFQEVIEIRHGGEFVWSHLGEVRVVVHVEAPVQLLEHELDGVQLGSAEIFITSEEVFQVGDVAGEHGGFLESLRCAFIILVDRIFVPILGLKRVDNVLPGEVVQVASA